MRDGERLVPAENRSDPAIGSRQYGSHLTVGGRLRNSHDVILLPQEWVN
jgi:hypothetical protein